MEETMRNYRQLTCQGKVKVPEGKLKKRAMVMLDVPTCSNAWGKSYGFRHVKVKLSYVKRSSAIESEGKTVGGGWLARDVGKPSH